MEEQNEEVTQVNENVVENITDHQEKLNITQDLDLLCKGDPAVVKVVSQLGYQTVDGATTDYGKILAEYEEVITLQNQDLERMQQELQTTSRHFANLELAFSDVLEKYDRSKKVIGAFKNNEEALLQNLRMAQEKLKQNEIKYESFKTHAKSQIDKFNVEVAAIKDKYEFEANKLRAMNKRLEIKCTSLETSLNQKTEECQQLSALCEDITTKQFSRK